MPARRKRAQTSSNTLKKSKREQQTTKTNGSTQTFNFLGLPAELRNEIYTLVCQNEASTGIPSARTKGTLVSKSPLALLHTSRQLRGECLSILTCAVPLITATVKNLDFGPLIAFFNRLDGVELHALPHGPARQIADGRHERNLFVKLDCPEDPRYFRDRLQRWLNRLLRPEKKGTGLRVEYRWVVKGEKGSLQAMLREMLGRCEDQRQREALRAMLRTSG